MSVVKRVDYIPQVSPPTFPIVNTNIREYYLYRHIRVDKNQVFYVGVGTKPKYYDCRADEYSRAYSRTKRNSYWQNIIATTDYIVEILYENTNEQEILDKEGEFVNLYGRANINAGSLCNLVDGGRARLNPDKEIYERVVKTRKDNGYTHSEETKERIRQSKIGKSFKHKKKRTTSNRKPLSEETKAKISAKLKGRIVPEEQKIKMSIAGKGKSKTPEHRLKISISNSKPKQ